MPMLNVQNSLIMIIDVQEKLLNAVFNKSEIEKNSVILAKTAKLLDIPVIVTEQYPKGLGATVDAIKEILDENTKFFEKTAFSALENLEIKQALEIFKRKQIIIFGIETHICVSQTANALKEAGYEVHVVSDACGSRVITEYDAGLRRMRDNGVYQITTEIALFELIKTSRNPKFKELQCLIK